MTCRQKLDFIHNEVRFLEKHFNKLVKAFEKEYAVEIMPPEKKNGKYYAIKPVK